MFIATRAGVLGVVAVAPPLTSASITSVAGSFNEGSTVTISCSWVGGTAPFQLLMGSTVYASGLSGTSGSFNTSAVAGVTGYTVQVKDAKGSTYNTAFYPASTNFIRGGSASYSFNTSSKVATFYATTSGYPSPSVAWYISINGGGYTYWSGSSVWSSGVFDTYTTIAAYFISTNSAGSQTSNSVYVTYS